MSGRDLQAEIHSALLDASIQDAVPKGARLAAMMRRQAVAEYGSYETARDRARRIKELAIEGLPELLETLEEAVVAAGGQVHHAEDGEAAVATIVEIARAEGVRSVVKSKSMTSEEIHLNAGLEAAGLAVRETDLGEYIVQLDRDRPSHIIAPILHKSLEDVRQAFGRGLRMKDVPKKPEELTQLARRLLRKDFLAADMGITGANFLIAESGTLVVVENEGNARLCTQLPRVHVALAGIEKVIPGMADLEPFLQLLPRSATGQLMASYLSIISGPGWGRSPLVDGPRRFHLVLLDNGRWDMRDDPLLREALYCVRCGACLNVCAPYQAVGGHVFGGPTYQSGIGVAWETGVRGRETAEQFSDLCTTCARCHDVCPVRIDIPWINSGLRARAKEGRSMSQGEAMLVEPRRLYETARRTSALASLVTSAPGRWVMEKALGIDARRPLPELADRTLVEQHRARGGKLLRSGDPVPPTTVAGRSTVVFWADCHTDHVDADAGMAAIRVLESLGYDVRLATGPCCGRAALSQGQLGEASRQAQETVRLLGPVADAGISIVGLEPSCVTCVTDEFAKLLPDESDPLIVAVAMREVLEFVGEHLPRLEELLLRGRSEEAERRDLIVHGHCQQKSAGRFDPTLGVLGRLPGVSVHATTAECCGMAGSFGYKPGGYDVSTELGRRLVGEIAAAESMCGESGADEVVACGTSCRAQLEDLGGRRPRHPVQLLADVLDGG